MRAIDADALKADHGMKDDCEDCEKELKGYVKQCQYDTVYTKMDFCGWIDAMPTIEPEPHWISCKERLPENYVDVLVWFEYYRYGSYNRLYQTYGIGTYSENYDSWTINHESGWHKLRVIAWQPLPEPYKEEGDKDGR